MFCATCGGTLGAAFGASCCASVGALACGLLCVGCAAALVFTVVPDCAVDSLRLLPSRATTSLLLCSFACRPLLGACSLLRSRSAACAGLACADCRALSLVFVCSPPLTNRSS